LHLVAFQDAFSKSVQSSVLQPYSGSMLSLLENGYSPGLRPSGHAISHKFGRNNGGAIPPNLIAVANTESNGYYQRYCKERGLPIHPARFPAAIPAFFIKMLTDPGYLVIDPFAGSCVTGYAAEMLRRRWICYELEPRYVEGARIRFQGGGPLPIFSRSDPYSISPPNLSINDSDAALVEDGGARRPR